MNQWAANGEKQEVNDQFWEFSGQKDEQHCFDFLVVCLTIRDTDKSFCGICIQKMTDGTSSKSAECTRMEM